jgi:hypothetical protein
MVKIAPICKGAISLFFPESAISLITVVASSAL